MVLEDYADDLLTDKHGCPAYVSPEILRSNTQYSGRSADMWGLGVMLYTMLVGRSVKLLYTMTTQMVDIYLLSLCLLATYQPFELS